MLAPMVVNFFLHHAVSGFHGGNSTEFHMSCRLVVAMDSSNANECLNEKDALIKNAKELDNEFFQWQMA